MENQSNQSTPLASAVVVPTNSNNPEYGVVVAVAQPTTATTTTGTAHVIQQSPVLTTVPPPSHQGVVVCSQPQALPILHEQTFAAPTVVNVEEMYCGPVSCCIACVLVLLFWPAALFVPCCPCDSRRRTVYAC
mmetsp:Transcript_26709/g.81991  ORF Transcript_26709/g.81991 Transcript_26709/m.81991 type:complete len:133 (-) Transcript_26709:637-1035(-)